MPLNRAALGDITCKLHEYLSAPTARLPLEWNTLGQEGFNLHVDPLEQQQNPTTTTTTQQKIKGQ